MSCDQCDTKHFVIYGYCKSCERKCRAPLFDPNDDIPLENHLEMVKNWQEDITYTEWGGDVCCIIDGKVKNMADELNKIERKK